MADERRKLAKEKKARRHSNSKIINGESAVKRLLRLPDVNLDEIRLWLYQPNTNGKCSCSVV